MKILFTPKLKFLPTLFTVFVLGFYLETNAGVCTTGGSTGTGLGTSSRAVSPTCSWQNISPGSGTGEDVTLTGLTSTYYYDFQYLSGGQNPSGTTGMGSNVTGITSRVIGVGRSPAIACGSWSNSSATLQYRLSAPTTAVAGADQTKCNNSSFTLTGNTPTVGTGTWTKVSGTGAVTSGGAVTGVTAGASITCRYTIANGACTSTDDLVCTNDVNPTITAPASVCDNSTATVSASVGLISVSSGAWASNTFTPTNLAPPTQNQNVTITATNGTCAPTQVIRVDNLPTITTPTAVCDNSTATVSQDITGAIIGVSAGSWASNTFTPPNVATPTQNQNVTITATNGACAPTAVIRVDNNTTAAAGADQAQCNNGNFTLAGNNPTLTVTGSTGTWSCTANCAGISYVSGSTYNTSMSSVPANTTTTLRWTVVNGACSNFDDANYRNDGLPVVTGPTSTCDADAPFTYTQTGGSGIVWSYIGTNATMNSGTGELTFSNIATPTNSVSGTVRATGGSCVTDKAITIYNKTTFTNSFASLCEGQSVTLTADVTGTTFSGTGVSGGVFTAPVIGGTSQSFILTATNGPTSCQDQQIITVYKPSTITSSSADMCQGGTRTLTATPGPGGFASVACPTCIVGAAFTAPTPVGNSQVIDIVYTVSGAPCSSNQNITVWHTPTSATVGASQAICGLTSTSLGGNTATFGTGAWSQISGPGSTSFSASGSGSSTATATLYGSYVYRWTISNGTCTPSTADVTVVFSEVPVAPTSGGDEDACYRATVPDLTATTVGGTVVDWYDAASGGSLVLGNSLTFNEATDGSGPNPLPNTYTYYLEARNTTSNCKSATRTPITLTVYAVPVIAPSASPSTSCSGDNVTLAANATAGSGSISTYAWSTPAWQAMSQGGTVAPTSTTTYTVMVTNSNSMYSIMHLYHW
jgi:hypothetical protein